MARYVMVLRLRLEHASGIASWSQIHYFAASSPISGCFVYTFVKSSKRLKHSKLRAHIIVQALVQRVQRMPLPSKQPWNKLARKNMRIEEGSRIVYSLAFIVARAALDSHNNSATAVGHLGPETNIPIAIKRFASLGDSYASGVGAGKLLDRGCWRYSDSYPAQLNNSAILRDSGHTMQFLACSGTVMKKNWGKAVPSGPSKRREIWDQIIAMEDADFVTLSVGGNDVGFFDLLNACLYRFYGPASPDCAKTTKATRTKIMGGEFKGTYNMVLDAILEKNPAESFRIFVTGYGKFFDEELTDECNNSSFGYWFGYRPKLTVEVRRYLNDISQTLNDVISQIIRERKDGRVIWVNWDPKFQGHRFCEPGKGLMDQDTWFYDTSFRTTNIGVVDSRTCVENEMVESGDWGILALCAIAVTHANYPNLEPVAGKIRTRGGRDPFGPKDARLFHPKPEGYAAIAEQIVEMWPYSHETQIGSERGRFKTPQSYGEK
ncbi:hypothetical protein CIRG_01793 [Coccidioides immitis RMSCC 2394]|uniref:Uncharacterized protein n=1 Tax=Coccidioides immitis RMSCC 2394 TaxID=404692 RepID=A0A0J6Y3T3_COCIT|nr:hypothetical protein CIRG_01793 [Coccidioides immitis RMSCC 2394]